METEQARGIELEEAARRVRRMLDDAGVRLVGQRVLALCSGGADSVALVELLAQQPRGAAPAGLEVLWLDHGLRDDVSAERAAARAVARRHDLVLLERAAKPGALQPAAGGVEAAARAWRYDIAAQLAHERGCALVATGHSASDQVEQVLLALLGVTGAPGRPDVMPVVRSLTAGIELVRPLLSLERRTLEQVCTAAGIAWADDPTNADAGAHRRNAVRLDIVPRLLEVQPGAGTALVRAGTRARAQAQVVPELAEALLDAWGHAERLDVRRLASLSGPARRGVISAWLARRGLGRARTTRLVAAVERLAVGPGRAACGESRVDVAGGACVRRDGYDLVLAHHSTAGELEP